MANFIEALGAGLDAANRLAADREEIDSVLADAAQQILAATKGAIRFGIQGFTRTPTLRDMVSMDALAGAKSYQALVLTFSSDGEQKAVQLAEWAPTKGGYPVKIHYESVENTCHDKQALENGIAIVLASPASGQKLRSMLAEVGISNLERVNPQPRRR
jgi:hypothetical protein